MLDKVNNSRAKMISGCGLIYEQAPQPRPKIEERGVINLEEEDLDWIVEDADRACHALLVFGTPLSRSRRSPMERLTVQSRLIADLACHGTHSRVPLWRAGHDNYLGDSA